MDTIKTDPLDTIWVLLLNKQLHSEISRGQSSRALPTKDGGGEARVEYPSLDLESISWL